jgi:hypothetical protein
VLHFGSTGCQDSFENLEHLPLLYLSFGDATNLHPYSNNIFHRQIEVPMMPHKLENLSGWYAEATTRKVKCLLYEASFAKKVTRMLSHLGYEGPCSVRDKGVSLCRRATPEIKRLFHECRGTFPLYPERVGVALSDSSGTPRVGGLHALRQGTPKSLHPGSSGRSVQVEIQGSQMNAREANQDTPNVVEHVTAMVRAGRQMRQARLPKVFQEVERRELDKAWVRFFYEANIPFVVSKNKAFKEEVRMTTEFCDEIYVPPSYHDLRRKFLVQAKKELQAHLQVKTIGNIHKFGATLAVDGWSSVTNCPLFNAMLVSPATEQFLGVVDTIGYPKTTE